MAAQNAIPLPATDVTADAAAAAPAAPAQPPAQIPPQTLDPVDPTLLQLAQQFDPGITPLDAPSQRPGEPITAGLSTGPGPGPEIFDNVTRAQRAASVLRMMAYTSGTNRYADIADRIEAHGGLI